MVLNYYHIHIPWYLHVSTKNTMLENSITMIPCPKMLWCFWIIYFHMVPFLFVYTPSEHQICAFVSKCVGVYLCVSGKRRVSVSEALLTQFVRQQKTLHCFFSYATFPLLCPLTLSLLHDSKHDSLSFCWITSRSLNECSLPFVCDVLAALFCLVI